MNLWRSLDGTIEVRLVSADITGFLDSLRRTGIMIHRVRFVDELTADICTGRREYPSLCALAEKRGESVTVLRRRGIFWKLKAAAHRPVLTVGLVLLMILFLYLPTRVLFVRVEGNTSVPARKILEAAQDCGIRFGATRREVRSEKMKNSLLGALPQLQWAGVNTSGCVATISVRERSNTQFSPIEEKVSSLVASRDGIIVSCTVTEGSAHCAVGQAVTAGQLLISGYTDCGILLRATRAEGEIMAQTRRTVTAIALPEGIMRGVERSESRNYSLILGKKRINLYNSSGICDTTCGRMYKEYYITLPGGFVLPVALAVDTHTCCQTQPFRKESEDSYGALSAFCDEYVRSQMVSGSILERNMTAQTGTDGIRLEAYYTCLEMIGKRRQEGKVETNGESD